jgi:ribonuclease HI
LGRSSAPLWGVLCCLEYTLFTDGSKDPKTRRTGAAFSVPEFQVAVTKRATDHLSVYTLELLAILLAAEWEEEVRPDRVVNCSDSYSTDELKCISVTKQTRCLV